MKHQMLYGWRWSAAATVLAGVLCAGGAAADLPAADTSAPAPRWWRGNLHTHTMWKEGDDFPEMAVAQYRDRGYNFVATTEHNCLAQGEKWVLAKEMARRAKMDVLAAYLERYGRDWVETRNDASAGTLEVRLKPFDEYRALVEEHDRFLVMQSEEITDKAENGLPIHLNAINLPELIVPCSGATVRDAISNNVQAAHALALRSGRAIQIEVNHVNYKWGVTAEDLAAVPGARFFEVWNGVTDDNDPGDQNHFSSDEIWDIANTLRLAHAGVPPLYGLATDDAHEYHGNKTRSIPGRGWVMVRAPRLTPESLLRAMALGDFYASSGVLLDAVAFDAAAGKLSVRITPCGSETFRTRFIGTRKGANLLGKPRRDADGKVVNTTLDYRTPTGPQVGEVFREVAGITAEYTLKGDEYYVRAVVTSSGETEVPSTEFKFKRAWTQPVGWHVSTGGKP